MGMTARNVSAPLNDSLDPLHSLDQRQFNLLYRLTLLTAIATYFLVVVGNIVRITESGLGCPDWPFCYGNMLPGNDSKAMIEMAHRYFAGIVSSMIVAIAVLAYRWRVSPRLSQQVKITGVLLAIQILLGALTVWSLLHEWSVALHLLCGMGVLGCTVAMHLEIRHLHVETQNLVSLTTKRLRRRLIVLATVIVLLLLTGGLMSGSGSAMACGVQFPLCNGGWLPNGSPLTFKHWLHRATVALVSLMTFSALWTIYKESKRGADLRAIRWPAIGLGIGLVAQATIGALIVLLQRPDPIATLHNAVGAFTWVCALSLAFLANRLPIHVPEREAKPRAAWAQTVADYVTLTKPRVISLLLFTTFAAMFVTQAGAPPWYLVVWTMIGGYLMAGGANAVNMAYDSDIDTKMARTNLRPVAKGRITPRHAFIFGITLGVLSLVVFVLFVNVLAAFLAAIGFFYYTVIYTHLLKRNTWQNIVIGGGAGAVPPLIGFAAASGQITLAALLLFVIIFYWTPPHFWALALLKRKDYAAAGVPMLPVVAGERETTYQMMLYSLVMVATTLILVPLQFMGLLYLVGATGLGVIFLWYSWKVNQQRTPSAALSLYKFSLLYLALLFVVMMADRLIAL